MKSKILLLSLFFAGIMNAQIVCDYPEGVETSLIITEIRLNPRADGYIEITNVGNSPVSLSNFKVGRLNSYIAASSPIFDLCSDPWYFEDSYIFLPGRMLEPGKSYVITNAYDYGPRHYKAGLGRLGGSERPKQIGLYEVADKLLHKEEKIANISYPGDSISTAFNDPEQLRHVGYGYSGLFSSDGISEVYYIEHHYIEGDSIVVDQVGGVFDNNGHNRKEYYAVAGVTEATGNSILIRKAIVTKGNVDFANARGISLDDSEWIPLQLPEGYNAWRDIFWTIGNHGNYQLDEKTLVPESDLINIDYASKKIMVPWGMLRLDEIMSYMKKKPGIAWQYDLNPIREDSLYRSARTGDQFTVYVAGNTLQSIVFDIEVKKPTIDDNIVIPIDHPITREAGMTGPITTRAQNGILSWPRVTRHGSGIDTITGSAFGLTFDLRTDTLLKYLEKPEKATWEIVWSDGLKRPDLKNGDKLKVTAESGKVKEYYIQVQTHWPSSNADLASIYWPDIPEFYRGIFGWREDTIPNFAAGTTNYRIEVPLDVEGIPALKAIPVNVNASVRINRAKSLTGTIADRTITFEVTAENDTVKKTYYVELVKEKAMDKIEPFIADPFISEFNNAWPNENSWVELFNPGNQPLDLRNYMISYMAHPSDPYSVINTSRPSWANRYRHYIPGLKHVDEATWAIVHNIMLPDPTVNPIIPGGKTFTMANINRGLSTYPDINSWIPPYDVQFRSNDTEGFPNNWNENVSYPPWPHNGNRANSICLFKILNDSIKQGLKSISDPNDFELIDLWGVADRNYWVIGGVAHPNNSKNSFFIRKPEISKGNPAWSGAWFNPIYTGSMGTNPDNCEWIYVLPNIVYGHISVPERYRVALSSLNYHYMIEPTYYKSTVNSSVYKVSDGFGPGESILGLKTGTTVNEFLSFINKDDNEQTLKVTSAATGLELGMDANIVMNDKLIVVSADESNTTHYRLDVTETGLSSNAYITSNRWTVEIDLAPKSGVEAVNENDGIGSVAGFDYGTTIRTIVDNITVPAGATLTVINGNGSYVPYKVLNFDTTYVSVTVNPDIFLDVVAEDGVTRIVYQLQPNTSENDAFILSDVYEVSQLDNLIHFVPRGTNFNAFLANIIPSLGASLKLIDKMGFERVYGNIREDDKVSVTSANGQTTRIYYISFLPTSTIPQTTYLAYVLSEAYSINQVDYIISAGLALLTSETLLDEFVSYLTPSMGATLAVVDKHGEVKTSGDLNDGDKLVVTSANGKIVTTYTLALDLTSTISTSMQKQIEIFPNPANEEINIQGVNVGNRIQMFSASGTLISEIKAQNNLEIISLKQVPSGMFIIVISDQDTQLGRYKAIRK